MKRAKEAVMLKAMEVKEWVDSPRGWSLLGAILGAGVGAVLMKKAFWVRESRAMGAADQARDRTQPLMLALGSAALGVFAALLEPVSNRERQPIEPAIGSSEGLMSAERPGFVGSDRSDSLASPTSSRIPPVPPLDDLSTKIH